MSQLTKIYLILLGLLVFQILLGNGQRLKECSAGSRCILLRSCPQMISLVQSGNPSNIQKVREAICGFQNRNSLVCCPSAVIEPPKPTTTQTNPLQLGNSDNLLPRLCGRPATDDKIINGAPAPIGGYPWMAAMGYTEPGKRGFAFVCSGSIINSRYILTAAHCVDPAELGRRRLAVIHLGDWDLETNEDCQATRLGTRCSQPHIVAGYEEITSHPKYNTRGRSSDDIALIRLNMTLDFENDPASIEPVCLPTKSFDLRSFAGNRKPIAAGWGLTEHGNNSNILLRVDVPFANESLCKERYRTDYVSSQLCIGGEGGFDTCSGDSGGPLVISQPLGPPFTQIGIVSFGPFPCGLQRFPGVYTSVADYRDWITSNLKP